MSSCELTRMEALSGCRVCVVLWFFVSGGPELSVCVISGELSEVGGDALYCLALTSQSCQLSLCHILQPWKLLLCPAGTLDGSEEKYRGGAIVIATVYINIHEIDCFDITSQSSANLILCYSWLKLLLRFSVGMNWSFKNIQFSLILMKYLPFSHPVYLLLIWVSLPDRIVRGFHISWWWEHV